MKITYEWRPWIPEGWTDDLGIISDKNRWVREQLPGWYVFIPYQKAEEVYHWCNHNLKHDWSYGAGVNHRKLYISSDKDFTWFSMKWL